jgi:hypothetical protein
MVVHNRDVRKTIVLCALIAFSFVCNLLSDAWACAQPFVVALSHAGLRARSLAIAGAPTLARATAEQGGLNCYAWKCQLFLGLLTLYVIPVSAPPCRDSIVIQACQMHPKGPPLTQIVLCAGLWQGNHDGLAAFMAATGRAALPEAAALSGLSLQKEFELCKGESSGRFICSIALWNVAWYG